MREILFRGKTESGCWTRGSLSMYSEPGKVEILYPVNFEDEDGNTTPGFDFAEVVPETVGQFTGLRDKNGKMIFEGDFVRLNSDVKEIFGVGDGVIKYIGGCFLVAGHNAGIRGSLHTLSDTNWVLRGAVIGNIHDNPELLGG